MSEILQAYLLYGLAWIAFGIAHSVLASKTLKRQLAHIASASYRLTYNGFAIISLIVTFWVGYLVFAETDAFVLTNTIKVALGITQISGWFLMYFALRQYDLGRFAGTHQLKNRNTDALSDDDESLQTKGLHLYVRHPLYSAVFLVLWGTAWTPFGLATAIFGSGYLLIGTYFEERRLLARHGETFADYRNRVPAFIPWRGRAV